jgi:uncharacterized membrane protein YfcA
MSQVPVVHLALMSCGALAGLLAGMLGIGGGLVIVPFLMALAPALLIDPQVLPQTIVATSLAAMVPTTCAAAWSQHLRGAVDVDWVRRFLPGVSVGIVGTTLLFGRMSTPPLMAAFVVYALWCGTHMLRQSAPQAATSGPGRSPRGTSRSIASVHAVAMALGVSSAAAGLGGAFISVPYLLSRGVPIRRVLATSSVISFLVCTEACLCYGLLFRGGAAAPPVQWSAALTVGLVAVAAAPVGVALSRRVSVVALRQVFGALAIVSALFVWWSL